MGLLDGLLGQVLSGAMGQGQAGAQRQGGMPGGLDAMLGGLAGGGMGASQGSGGGGGALMNVLLQMMQQNGGLGGLLSQFQQAGHGREADSWVSTGQNEPISGDVLSKVLGSGQLDQIAQQMGMSRGQAADQVASALPDVVNHMTPQGSVPDNSDDLVNQAMAILQRGQR